MAFRVYNSETSYPQKARQPRAVALAARLEDEPLDWKESTLLLSALFTLVISILSISTL